VRRWATGLVVVACCVVLVAVAAPLATKSLQGVGKSQLLELQVQEGLLLASGVKVAMAEYYNTFGRFPPSNVLAGLAAPEMITGKYVARVQVGPHSGVIEVVFSSHHPNFADERLNNKVLGLTATADAQSGMISWRCGGPLTTVPQKYLPAACQQSQAEIDLEAKLLAKRDQAATREREQEERRRKATMAADTASANARAEHVRLAALAESMKTERTRQLLMQRHIGLTLQMDLASVVDPPSSEYATWRVIDVTHDVARLTQSGHLLVSLLSRATAEPPSSHWPQATVRPLLLQSNCQST
jgi:type IV pilus assembly protein PilA